MQINPKFQAKNYENTHAYLHLPIVRSFLLKNNSVHIMKYLQFITNFFSQLPLKIIRDNKLKMRVLYL